MNIYRRAVYGPLGGRVRATTEIMTGKPRAHALRDMSQEPVLRRWKGLFKPDSNRRRGNQNLAESIDEYTKELRASRLRKAEEEARKLPTKIVGPLVLCIFLPMVILLMAPVMSIISQSL